MYQRAAVSAFMRYAGLPIVRYFIEDCPRFMSNINDDDDDDESHLSDGAS